MAVGGSSISNIEKRRLELENNVAKLEASLRHWQAWEIEYEGMKEEISKLGDQPLITEIDGIADSSVEASLDSNKVLLTKKERSSIVRDEKGITRKPAQIINLLSRRIDYVQQNVRSVSSLLETSRKDLITSEVLTEAKALNEEGLPLIDILEELDEDGNFISGSTSVPGETAPNAVEAIERAAGLRADDRKVEQTELGEAQLPNESLADSSAALAPTNSLNIPKNTEESKSEKYKKTSDASESIEEPETQENEFLKRSAINQKAGSAQLPKTDKDIGSPSEPENRKKFHFESSGHENIPPPQKPANPKVLETGTESLPSRKPNLPPKQVSFVNDTEAAIAEESAREHKASEQKLLQEISDREADELERSEMAEAIIPEDESPEDALLRRQMIQYNLEEVGAIVAEIDLEDEAQSQSEHESDFDMEDIHEEELDMNDDEDEDDEEEDEYGRTTKSKPLDESYVRRMQALSDNLKANAMVNIGPSKSFESQDVASGPTAKPPPASSKGAPRGKKGVRFAKDLDIQEAPINVPNTLNKPDEDPEVSVANLLATSSAISGKPIAQMPESKHMLPSKSITNTSSHNPSKFKTASSQASINADIAAAFNQKTQTTAKSSSNPQKILADTLVERPVTTSAAPQPPALANADTAFLDPESLQGELSTEYHRLRNRQIQREGGFVRDADNGSVLIEEATAVASTDNKDDDSTEPKRKKISRFKAARLGMQ